MDRTHVKRIGRRIAAERARLGMSQQQLLTLLGVTQQTMSNIENGKFKRLEGTVLVALARYLETTTDYLLSGRGDPREEHDRERTNLPAEMHS